MQIGPPSPLYGSLLLMGAGPGGGGGGGVAEVTRIVCVDDVAGSLHTAYFLIYEAAGSVAVWFNHGGGSPPAAGDRQLEIGYTDDAPAATIALALQTALDNDAAWSAMVNSETVDVTDAVTGERTDAADGVPLTGFTITVTTQGE